jgi:hypothetical protein
MIAMTSKKTDSWPITAASTQRKVAASLSLIGVSPEDSISGPTKWRLERSDGGKYGRHAC